MNPATSTTLTNLGPRIGYLVTNIETDWLLEGPHHAARIYSSATDARHACGVFSKLRVVPLHYHDLVKSLENGAAFCFESADKHAQFLRRLRNDPARHTQASQCPDPRFISWKDPNPYQAKEPSLAPVIFNPAILTQPQA